MNKMLLGIGWAFLSDDIAEALKKGVRTLEELAEKTPTQIDDKALEMAGAALGAVLDTAYPMALATSNPWDDRTIEMLAEAIGHQLPEKKETDK